MADPIEKKPIEELKQQAQVGEAVTEARAQAGEPTPVVPGAVRRYRALLFQGYVIAAAIAFGVLFFYARTIAYFDFDITIEHWLQSFHAGWFDVLMQFVSGLGFNPLVYILCALTILFVFVTGLRWESLALLFAAGGVSLLGALVKIIVHRQRPTTALVNVFSPLSDYSFPSGHVLLFTAFLGFLWFLIYTLSPHSWRRRFGLIFLGALIALVGVSRVYLGQHWPSDVLGAYLLGSVWLAITIYFYRWGKQRFFVNQPLAPEPAAGGTPVAQPDTVGSSPISTR